jgi:energy-coupling factor transporter transmembrane protein EcfT
LLVIFENIVFGNIRGAINTTRVILPLVILAGIVTIIFGGSQRAILVVLKIITGSLGFAFYFAVTNPSDLARSLEKTGVSAKIAMIPALVLTIVPRVAKDAEETIETLVLRGEIKGFFLRWLPKVLAIFIASVLYRSEFLAQSLYYRGFGMKKRSHYRSVPLSWIDILRLIYWLLLVLFLFLGPSFF